MHGLPFAGLHGAGWPGGRPEVRSLAISQGRGLEKAEAGGSTPRPRNLGSTGPSVDHLHLVEADDVAYGRPRHIDPVAHIPPVIFLEADDPECPGLHRPGVPEPAHLPDMHVGRMWLDIEQPSRALEPLEHGVDLLDAGLHGLLLGFLGQ